MDQPSGYVEIDRHFSKLNSAERSEDSVLTSYVAGSRESPNDLGWTELLKDNLVVILGEPGSGKSWELRHRCAAIRAQGGSAFFVELERLVLGAFNDILTPGDLIRFQQWKRADEAALFALDSVDEAKLRRQGDFHTALEKVQHAIGPAIERAQIVISSRISEWRPETDRREVRARFGAIRTRTFRTEKPTTTERESSEVPLLVVQIQPLSRDQVRKFVAGCQLGSPDDFLAALDEHSAWDFAGRPLDVLDLVEFWTRNGRFGSLTEIIENNVRLKLKETTQRLNHGFLSEASVPFPKILAASRL